MVWKCINSSCLFFRPLVMNSGIRVSIVTNFSNFFGLKIGVLRLQLCKPESLEVNCRHQGSRGKSSPLVTTGPLCLSEACGILQGSWNRIWLYLCSISVLQAERPLGFLLKYTCKFSLRFPSMFSGLISTSTLMKSTQTLCDLLNSGYQQWW